MPVGENLQRVADLIALFRTDPVRLQQPQPAILIRRRGLPRGHAALAHAEAQQQRHGREANHRHPRERLQRPHRIAARRHTRPAADRTPPPMSPVASSRTPLNCTQRRYWRRAGRCAPSVRPNSLLVVPAGFTVVTVVGRTSPSSCGVSPPLLLRRSRQAVQHRPEWSRPSRVQQIVESRGRSAARPTRAARSGQCPCGWSARLPAAYSASMPLARIRKRTPRRTESSTRASHSAATSAGGCTGSDLIQRHRAGQQRREIGDHAVAAGDMQRDFAARIGRHRKRARGRPAGQPRPATRRPHPPDSGSCGNPVPSSCTGLSQAVPVR